MFKPTNAPGTVTALGFTLTAKPPGPAMSDSLSFDLFGDAPTTNTKAEISHDVPVAVPSPLPIAETAKNGLSVQFGNMPPELKALPRWVCWEYRHNPDNPNDKPSKLPMQTTGQLASCTKPHTWTTYEAAKAAYENAPTKYAGVGFVLDGDGVAGVDIDDCFIDDVPSPEAMALLASLNARYIEVSPSGKGLRAFGYADSITGANGQIGGLHIEFYTQGRYLTLTGHVLQTGPLSELIDFADKAQQARDGKKATREASKPVAATNISAPALQASQGGVKASDRGVNAYAKAALNKAAEAVANAPEGQRNDALNSNALSLFRLPVVDSVVVWDALQDAAVGNGLPQSEVTATLASARNAAATMPPREVPPSKPRGSIFPPLGESPFYGQAVGDISTSLVNEEDDIDNHRNAPHPSPDCLYGLVGEVAYAGSAETEANPFAIAANFIAYMSCALGRGAYMPVGNTWHHARQFTLHVGRSGRGRKGDATALVKRIDWAIKELDKDLSPQVHAGGLSSREGLVFLIHDGYEDGKKEVQPILDKRLWVLESEFANILHQSKRDGNTLSAAMRDSWDGTSLKPATKTNRLWATDPHICISGAVTPSELLGLMASRELTNGFANRFLMFWAERTKMLAFPVSTPKYKVEELANKAAQVLDFAGAARWAEKDVMSITFSPEARKRYEYLYHVELNDDSSGEKITALIERRAPMLLRLAMLFALCDKTTMMDVQHINAALAWVRYSVESVKFIFGSAQAEAEASETGDTAQRIVVYLESNETTTRSQLTTGCFNGHTPKARIDAALDELLTCNPPQIVVHEDRSQKGRPTKFYKLSAKYAKKAKKVPFPNETADFDLCEVSEVSAKKVQTTPSQDQPSDLLHITSHTSHTSQPSKSTGLPYAEGLTSHTSQYFAHPENKALHSVEGLTSHTSHTSQAFSKNPKPSNRTPEQHCTDGLKALHGAWEATGRQMDNQSGRRYPFIPQAAIVEAFEREGLPEKFTKNTLAQCGRVTTSQGGLVLKWEEELVLWGVAPPKDNDVIEVAF